jgi:hypothetical protein
MSCCVYGYIGLTDGGQTFACVFAAAGADPNSYRVLMSTVNIKQVGLHTKFLIAL